MIETEKGIPNFQQNGYLPYKCYEVTLNEIKEKLVDNFPDSKTRQSRFECFMRFYKDLLKNVKSCIRILIDGSFVENEQNPNDIDFVIILDSTKYNDYEKFYLHNEFEFKRVLRDEFKILKEQKNFEVMYKSDFFKYGCDFFPVVKEEKNSKDYSSYMGLKRYWIKQWGHDRHHVEKGFLNLKVNYEEDFNEI